MNDGGGDTPPLLFGRSCCLRLDRPLLMGVLNVTPDSFFDGGRFRNIDDVLNRAEQMILQGVDLIDVGGESTRPGAPMVSVQEELDRTVLVVEALTQRFDSPVSIDTSKSLVAYETINAGASFVNDISGLSFDPNMAKIVADGGAGLFLMHTRGRPDEMQGNTEYDDLMHDVIVSLQSSIEQAKSAGVSLEKIAIDPGIGFGKSVNGNLKILHRLDELRVLNRPILLGTSRKSFIGKVLGYNNPDDRLYGSLATIALGVAAGVQIFRVHDVAASRDVAMLAWSIARERMPGS
jgi:dihydropteroate synthase